MIPGINLIYVCIYRWLIYLLDHQYTQHGLGWDNLKGADRKTVSEFLGTAKELDLEACLALADIREVWQAEEEK